MEYIVHSHRYASSILANEPEFYETWQNIIEAIENISEDMLIETYENRFSSNKSLSTTINYLLKQEFIRLGWRQESPIFQDARYNDKAWRLDFAKDNVSIEVAFNHGGVIAWNLLKPVLASELNHVTKAIQTRVGVVISATDALRVNGGFDNAVGTFEKYVGHLAPLQNQLSVPIAIIGLQSPRLFHIEHFTTPENPNKQIGRVVINREI